MYPRTKYEHKPWYPGLMRRDAALWDKFIDKYPDAYEEVIYNLHVGQGATIPKGTAPEIAKDFVLLTQWKIDVVGFKNNEVHIIEIKPYAGANAVGQLLTYCEIYKGYIDPEVEPLPVLVTDQVRPDVPLLAARLSFRVFVV